MGLCINESKTKFMVMNRHSRIMQNITVRQYTFEQVENKYIVVSLNNRNDMHNKIRLRLNAENGGYYTMNKIFSSKFSPKKLNDP